MRRQGRVALSMLIVLLVLLSCSRSSEPTPAAPKAAPVSKAPPIAQGMSGDREEFRYVVTIEADDPSYALKRLKALPNGMTNGAQSGALALNRDNPLDIERTRYLDFLRILQELGALQVERQAFITKEPATAPIPFVLRLMAAQKSGAKPQKAKAN